MRARSRTPTASTNNVLANSSNATMPPWHQYGSSNAVSQGLLVGEMVNGPPGHRTPTHPPVANTFERNIVVVGATQQRVTLVGETLKINFSVAVNLESNLYWSTRYGEDLATKEGTTPLGSWRAWQSAGHDRNSRVDDPLFADLGAGDFSLRSGSPALDLGFVPLDDPHC